MRENMHPTKIAFGFANGVKRFTDSRVITLSPVIDDALGPHDRLSAYRIVVSGIPPAGVVDTTTTFSFQVMTVPSNEEPYEMRFFFEQVEWKDVTKGFEWQSADWMWDDFVAERMGTEWHSERLPEFLGIAREVDHEPSDPQMREYHRAVGGSFIGGFYRLPVPHDG